MSGDDERWELNYFNYFTEVEERFQRARGTGLFLLSPVDWALIESWKNAGIPLEAVIRGIDAAFEKWRSRKSKLRMINSLAYCTQAVMEAAEALAGVLPAGPSGKAEPPFPLDELRNFLAAGLERLRAAGADYASVAAALAAILDGIEAHSTDLEQLEQRLTAIEEQMGGIARAGMSPEEILAARRELDAHLRPYRGKMNAAQLAMLEKQYLDRHVLERTGLPRLSLFYLR